MAIVTISVNGVKINNVQYQQYNNPLLTE
jgi:hypothetical protein